METALGDRVGELAPDLKPRLRGVLHDAAFAISRVTGTVIVCFAASARDRVSASLSPAPFALPLAPLAPAARLRVAWPAPGRRLGGTRAVRAARVEAGASAQNTESARLREILRSIADRDPLQRERLRELRAGGAYLAACVESQPLVSGVIPTHEIGRAHGWTPVTDGCRRPAAAAGSRSRRQGRCGTVRND